MPLDSLQKLFVEELKDVYHAEKQLVAALPKLADAASDPDLAEALAKHLKETEGHVARIEQVFQILGLPNRGKTCKGMQGLVEEGKEILEEKGEDSVVDAALISAAQRVEHYGNGPPTAAYGATLNCWATPTSPICSSRRFTKRKRRMRS